MDEKKQRQQLLRDRKQQEEEALRKQKEEYDKKIEQEKAKGRQLVRLGHYVAGRVAQTATLLIPISS